MSDNNISAVKRDILVSLVLISLGIFAIININMSEGGKITETATLTAATLPTIYSSLLIFLAVIVLTGALRKLITGRHGSQAESVSAVSIEVKVETSWKMIMLRTWGTLGLLIVYALLLAHVNFIVLTTAFLAALFVLFGRRKPWAVAIASALGGTGFYLLFIYFLKLPI